MNRLQHYYSQFHPVVWVLLAGTVLARGSAYMTLPFLAIYLSSTMELHPVLIGITIGISPLTGTIGGFFGGYLSDKFGRKPVMLWSVFGIGLVYFGFLMAEAPGWFILFNALNGLAGSFFEPTSQALISDLTAKEKRMRAFSLRYTAINIGASVGPLLGAYLALSSAKSAFLLTGGVYLLYGAVLLYVLNAFKIKSQAGGERIAISSSIKIIGRDKALGFLILGSILVNLGYAQVESNLPQHLSLSIENSVFVYSVLLSLNAGLVVLLQMPISHYAERFRTMSVMMAGAVFMAAGLMGFGLVNGWGIALMSMALLTIGEILIFPSSSYLIDQIAPEHMRGTYFGAAQFRKLGHFAGPILGGFLLSGAGGLVLFAAMAVFVLCSTLFFVMGNRVVAPVPARAK
ncbi:MFS transporter [Bacillus sp. FJAT-27251]|uniref:MDR family MFS transporter n=1 Tax=Bacillus sp. FJAT-27251 TaxID=1684142 RepID=UPI0006A7AEFB|nr:MFS transporter [Bacillus sp. FJAT-27251]